MQLTVKGKFFPVPCKTGQLRLEEHPRNPSTKYARYQETEQKATCSSASLKLQDMPDKKTFALAQP